MIGRKWLLATAAHSARAASWVLLRLFPPRAHAVVHGWPDSEPNSLEVLRALRHRYRGRIYWLLDDPTYVGPPELSTTGDGAAEIVRLPKRSPRAVMASLTAELTCFTHGLYTAVSPPDNRLVVNLWHGDGPKAMSDADMVRSTVVVSATQLWGNTKARAFQLPQDAVAVVGNPRIDQFNDPLTAQEMKSLGLSSDRKLVLWLPTFREARGPRYRRWSDAGHLTGNDEVHDVAGALAEEARALELDLVIKPHPLDADRYDALGMPVVRAADLDAVGVSLYQVLGHCDAIISDISSVWVDFLVLDRPVGFFIPDLDELDERRGLNVDDFASLMPGPRITTAGEARRFLQGVQQDDAGLRPSSYPGLPRIGLARNASAAESLLDWLDDYQRRRGRRPLFSEAAVRR